MRRGWGVVGLVVLAACDTSPPATLAERPLYVNAKALVPVHFTDEEGTPLGREALQLVVVTDEPPLEPLALLDRDGVPTIVLTASPAGPRTLRIVWWYPAPCLLPALAPEGPMCAPQSVLSACWQGSTEVHYTRGGPG